MTNVSKGDEMSLLGYNTHNDLNLDFWRELGIAIDPIEDLEDDEKAMNQRLETVLNRHTFDCLKELCGLYHVEFSSDISKENLISRFNVLKTESKKEIVILQEFLNRKKRAIDKVYLTKTTGEPSQFSNSLARVKHMFDESPKLLMESFTYFLWKEKGSGILYTLNKAISFNNLLKLPNEYRISFRDRLRALSSKKNNFKIHSYYALEEKEIILNVYKQVNDTPRPDFDRAIRNKEVSTIMFRISTEQKLVEIKGTNRTDTENIITYLKETFPVKVSAIESTVFRGYDPEGIRHAFLTGEPVTKDKVNDFIVSKISFRSSLVKKSPKITFELENESIWPSVIDAKNRSFVSLRSIKDIEHIVAQVQNKKRLIRSTILPNGNVIFSLDDSKMEDSIRESFIGQFRCLFGIPLFQEISNYEFFDGKADKIDYLMALSNPSTLSQVEKVLFDQLVVEKLINEKQKLRLTCKSCGDVSETDDLSYDISSYHCSCENTSCYEKKIITSEVDLKKVMAATKKKFTLLMAKMGYEAAPKLSTINIDEEKYQFINFYNKDSNETIQLFITSDHIRSSFIKRLTTMMIPTIIITVGMVEEAVQTLREQGVYPINFGKIYLSDEMELHQLIYENVETIQLQSKSSISKAADHAYASLKRVLGEPSKVEKGYTDKMFEDDVFAILKDMVPNGEKWGKEKSGKPFPEGIFAISTKNTKREDLRRVFSYDCKFTKKDEGYDLGKGEQRKAIDYVEKLNDNPYIIKFSDKEELSSHIFISNRFQDQQKEGMRDHFNEKLGEKYNTRPVFLEIESLLHLHECYRKNEMHINANRNLFYERLILLLTRENINKQEIDKMFRIVLDKELAEHRDLDTKKVSDSLEGEI